MTRTRGAISAGAKATAEAGARVLEAGGTAADAAVAAVFASFACECVYTSPGAGGVALVREPSGNLRAFDCFAAMPGLGADRRMSRDELDFREVSIIFGNAKLSFHIGRGSVAVPGILKGLADLHARYGRIPMAELLQPAIDAARNGFSVTPAIVEIGHVLDPIMRDTPEMYAALGGPDNYFADPAHMTLPPLADVLERLAVEGTESFYTGDAARVILEDQQRNGGLLTARDLADYRVLELEPLRVRLGEGRMATLPPPSLGGSMVVTILRLWRALERDFGKPALQSVDFFHRWAVTIQAVNKSRRLVDQVREVGDADHFIDTVVASLYQIAAPAIRERRPVAPIPTPRVPGNTTHVSVMDETGLAVSITSSPGESAGFIVPGLGMMMNNMLGEDDLFTQGFHSEKAGMRLPTMMAPSILELPGRSGLETVVFGTGGSIRIRTALSQFMYYMADEKLPFREAIEEPRVHIEKDILHLEGVHPPQDADALRAMGYTVDDWGRMSAYFGGINAVLRRGDGSFDAHADTRRGGTALVVE